MRRPNSLREYLAMGDSAPRVTMPPRRGGGFPSPGGRPLDPTEQLAWSNLPLGPGGAAALFGAMEGRRQPPPHAAPPRRGRARSVAQIVGEGMIDEANSPSMRIADIPLGRDLAAAAGVRDAPGPATGYRTDRSGRPLGLIRWGLDGRRPFGEIMSDVERASGAPAGFLTAIGARESVGNVTAQNDSSTAFGAHQFTEGTWRAYMRQAGARYGLPESMSDEEMQSWRADPRWSAAMTAEYARDNAARFHSLANRAPTQGDLYLAHFGGDHGLALAADHANGSFSHSYGRDYFTSGEVKANGNVFFHPIRGAGGRVQPNYANPRTSAEVYRYLTEDIHKFPAGPAEFAPRQDGSNEPSDVQFTQSGYAPRR